MRTHLLVCAAAAFCLATIPIQASTIDNWSGGIGNWNTASNWSTASPPTSTNDAFIDSSVGDTVTLDTTVSSAPGVANSLTLGKSSGSESYLTVTSQSLTLGGDLTVNQAGWLQLGGGSTVTASGNATNSGYVDVGDCGSGSGCSGTTLHTTGGLTNTGTVSVEYGGTLTTDSTFTNSGSGSRFEVGAYGPASANVNALSLAGTVQIDPNSTLNITGGGSGVTDVASNTTLIQNGTFEVSGSTNALANLATVEGTLELGNQQTTTVNGPLTNSGYMYVGDCGSGSGCSGTTLHTTGGLTNTGTVSVEYGGTLTTDGTFTNSGSGSRFEVGVYGPASANVNALSLAGTVQIDPNSTLNITGGGSGVTDVASNTTLIQNGTFEVSGSTNALANLATVEGMLELGNQQTTTVNGLLTNSGYMDVGDCGSGSGCSGTTLHTTGGVTNTGTVNVEYGGTLATDGTFTNSGSGSRFEVGLDGQAASTLNALNNSGTVQVDPGSTLSASNFTNNPGATVTLEAASGPNPGGKLDPTTYTSGGVTTVGAGSTLDVGSGTPGVTGYDQTSDGTLEELLFGPLGGGTCTGGSTSDCGIINVNGDATLSGTLDPILENGFDPMNGDSFIFMTFTGTRTGTFNSMLDQFFDLDTQQWAVTYGSDYVALTAEAYTPVTSPVPEPGTLALLGIGLLGFGISSRKFQKRNRAGSVSGRS